MIVSGHVTVGGNPDLSTTSAEHASFLEVESTRGNPGVEGDPVPPMTALREIIAFELVPKVTVAPGPTLTDVAAASLLGPPPGNGKISTPTCCAAVSVDM